MKSHISKRDVTVVVIVAIILTVTMLPSIMPAPTTVLGSSKVGSSSSSATDVFAFVSNRAVDGGMPNYDIYLMNITSGNITRLTTDPAVDNHPHMTPDGSKIVWSSDRAGDFDIYVADVSDVEGTIKRLTNDSYPNGPQAHYPDRHPGDFTPDGSMFVFTSKNRPQTITVTEIITECSVPRIQTKTVVRFYEGMNVIKINTTTGELLEYKELNVTAAWDSTMYPDIWNVTLPNATYAGHPSFSPDGSKIVFSASIDGEGNIWEVYTVGFDNTTMDLVSNSLRRITKSSLYPPNPNPIKMSGGAHFTPDGSKIVFSSTRTTQGNSQLFWAWANKTDQPVNGSRRLTSHLANDYVPEPLPDGRIIFVSDRGIPSMCGIYPPDIPGPTMDLDIFIMNPDGTNQTNLTNNDLADETLLLADEVSWFCGLPPNLKTCTYYPRKMNLEALWLIKHNELIPNDILAPFHIKNARDLYSNYWHNLESYMSDMSGRWPGYWNLWTTQILPDIQYLNDTFPGLKNQTALDSWLNQTTHIREKNFVLPSIMYRKGIGQVPLGIHLDAEPPSLIDLKKPVSTQWHELYPNYSRQYHLSSWQDNCDGVLSRSDYIDLEDKETGKVEWYHVEEVTVTITLTLKPHLNYTMYLEFNGTQDEFLTIGDPRSTWWYEIWPNFCTWWHILTWTDTDGSGTLTVSDQVDFEDGTEWHVDAVKTDIIVTKITIPGDINLDGVIDIFDIVIAAAAFGSQLGDPNWDERADLVLPLGLIDIFDLVKIASHYGQSAP